MFVRSRFALALTLFAASTFCPSPSGLWAQPDPALPGVCYATLGNNASSPGALITIDAASGAGTMIGPTGIVGQFGDRGVPALAIKSTGEMYAADIGTASKLYRIDATTGAAKFVATTSLSSPPALAFDGLDGLWAVDNLGNLYTVNDSTGASSLLGPTGAFIKGLAFDPTDGKLWGSDAGGAVYTINPNTGAATLVGNTGLPASPDLRFDAAGTLYGSSGGGLVSNNLITIDKATGAGAIVGAIGYAAVAGMASRLDRIVPVALQAYASSWAGDRVEVTWRLIDIGGAISFAVFRAESGRPFTPLQAAEIGEHRGAFVFVDRAVEPGATYTYRVLVYEDGEAITAFETSVTTPLLATSLDQNTPNPFNPTTRIRFAVGNPDRVSLQIYDVAGKTVRTLVDRPMPAGRHAETWDGRDDRGRRVAGGVYFYRLRAGKQVLTRKAVLLK